QNASAGDNTPRDVSFEDNAVPSHNAEVSEGSSEGGQA
ncbi:MAG: hypothetical protein QOJ60_2203, partial [Actinomycetota bacterium]|nr:hypothetical protein [Actinomycetota bacterium]